jgi:hypothetical protein
MKSMTLARTLALLVAALGACSGDDDDDDDGGPTPIPFLDFVSEVEVEGTTSTLERTADGVTATNHVVFDPMFEGHAFTYWFVIFNIPSECETSPCSLADFVADRGEPAGIRFDGFVLDSSLEFDFTQTRTIADGPADPDGNGDVVPGDMAYGLSDPLNAEIHVLTRSHGLEISDDYETQIGSINGGCPPNTCANILFAPHTAPL